MPSTKFSDRVQSRSQDLTASERRLVERVFEQPRRAALATAAELARDSGVHEATVSRLARKLEFSDYATFRQALQQEFIPEQETATRMKRTLDETQGAGIFASLIHREVAALSESLGHIDEEQIQDVARRIMSARRLYLSAGGNATVLSGMMARRFRRFGKDVHELSGDWRDLAEGAFGMASDDILVVYAFHRQPAFYAPLLEHARSVGAQVVVISGATGPLLTPRPDVLICAPRGGDAQSFQTLTVPMAISNAIILAAGAANEEFTIKALESLGQLIRRFE